MARRHKKRTHVPVTPKMEKDVPKSMVIKMGDPKRKPTKALSALVRDFRQVMQPHTAAKLRERKSNKLKDFFAMAGPLGVTHFFIFSQSLSGNTTLRIGRTPRGPTLYFRVKEYTLSRDIQRVQARPHALTPQSPELLNPPVLVMNNFSPAKASDMDSLVTSMFQNMLPTIHIDQDTSLAGVRRVMLLNRVQDTGDIELRHYAVITRVVGTSRAIKKLDAVSRGQREVPDLHSLRNVAQYMVDPSASDSEGEDEIVQAPLSGISQPAVNAASRVKKAVKLVETGPRLTLSLLKIEENLCSGKTLYHTLESRTSKEAAALEQAHQQKDAERARRRKEQEDNVQRKREADAARSSRRKRGEERAKLRQQLQTKPEDEAGADEEGSDASDFEKFDQDVGDMNDYELEAELADNSSGGLESAEDEDEIDED